MPEHDATAEPLEVDERESAREALGDARRELEAARVRLQREAKAEAERTRTDLVLQLLPVVDDLDRAIAAAGKRSDAALLKGVALVRDELAAVLHGYGLDRFDPLGLPFDPQQHEATAVVDVSRPELDGRAVAVQAPGYRVGERVVRPAKVHVGRYRVAGPRWM